MYDVFEIQDHTINCYKEPVGTHIFFATGAGALTAPPRPPVGLLATFGGFDNPTLTCWPLSF